MMSPLESLTRGASFLKDSPSQLNPKFRYRRRSALGAAAVVHCLCRNLPFIRVSMNEVQPTCRGTAIQIRQWLRRHW